MDSEQVMAAVRRSTQSESAWQQNLLVAPALAAHQATKQLLTLEQVANSRGLPTARTESRKSGWYT